MTKRQDALDYHSHGRPGKIAVVPTKPLTNQRDLSLAYSPGVAEPCLEIERDQDLAYKYTAKGNLVAVVTNGTAVLGLGNIGALAGKPVMEGKGNLFKQFADLDVFDLEVGSENPDDVIKFCQLLEPTVGGINLEDIKRAGLLLHRGDAAEDAEDPGLPRRPARHRDHLRRRAAQRARDRRQEHRQMSASSSPAPAPPPSPRAEHYVRLGVKRENIIMCDRAGRDLRGPHRRHGSVQGALRRRDERAHASPTRSSAPTSSSGCRSPARSRARWSQRWRRSPIIFALANPVPEILPDEVRAVRDDAIIATGRSDYPNQVNNVLGFPFIFRGALDVRATEINEEMKMAATRALALLAKEDVPDSVAALYGLRDVQFGPDYLIPFPFDPRVLLWVAPAVAWAAVASGVGDASSSTSTTTASSSRRGSAARAASCAGSSIARARDPKRVVFPEGEEPKIIRAAQHLRRRRHRASRSCSATASAIERIARAMNRSRSTTSRSRIRRRRARREEYAHYHVAAPPAKGH